MASKPFNFYQGGTFGTGFYYPYTALDFFTGVYFPGSLAAGQTVGFLWEGMGQKIVEQTVTFSGQTQDSNKETASLRLGFYGYSTPLVTESGRTTLRVSGNIPSDTVDLATFSLVARGSGIRDTIDSGILKLNLVSGIQLQDNHEIGTLTTLITSGGMSRDTSEPINYITRIWGNFFAKSTPDDASINVQITSISYATTAFRTVVSSGTGVAISFRMTDIFYDTAI